jgi:hypothetical protein
MTPRIAPLEPPYEPEIEAALAKWMPPDAGIEPLRLFRTVQVHEQLASRMRVVGAGDRGLVPPDRLRLQRRAHRPGGVGRAVPGELSAQPLAVTPAAGYSRSPIGAVGRRRWRTAVASRLSVSKITGSSR